MGVTSPTANDAVAAAAAAATTASAAAITATNAAANLNGGGNNVLTPDQSPNDGLPPAESLDNFSTVDSVMGLTSTIVEEIDIGRSKFTTEHEEPFVNTEVVITLALDINGMLDTAGVRPPINEQATNVADRSKVSFVDVCAFENAVKSSWGNVTANTSDSIHAQMKLFLARFFDRNSELNNIFGPPDAMTGANPSITYLDDSKITNCLNWPADGESGCTYVEPVLYDSDSGVFDFSSAAPKEYLSANLLSTRQIVQVLEAFAALGTTGANSRLAAEAGDDHYKYKLHEGDSIIGATIITDLDDRNQIDKELETNPNPDPVLEPHSRKVKIQLVQQSPSTGQGI